MRGLCVSVVRVSISRMTNTQQLENESTTAGTATPYKKRKALTITEAAEYLGKSPGAVRGRVERGTLSHIKSSSGKRMIPVIELDRWRLQEHEKQRDSIETAVERVQFAHGTFSAVEWFDKLQAEVEKRVELERRIAFVEAEKLLAERSEDTYRAQFFEVQVRADGLQAEVEKLEALLAEARAQGAVEPVRRRWFRRN